MPATSLSEMQRDSVHSRHKQFKLQNIYAIRAWLLGGNIIQGIRNLHARMGTADFFGGTVVFTAQVPPSISDLR